MQKYLALRCRAEFVGLIALSAIVLLPFASTCDAAPAPAESPVPLPSAPIPSLTSSPAQNGPVPARDNSPAPSITPSAAIENSVVKVFSTMARPDPYRPWSKLAPTEVSGSGAIISGNRILTNAHMVLYASQIQIQASQAGDKIPATVEAVAPGIDLAVLKLDDAKFFESHSPIPLRKTLPDVKEPVLVYGYPTGGNSLSITKGIISRIEFTPYTASVPGLRIQIDAAINPGNSGGPAVVGDEMIGIAFSHLMGAQNIGYIIPCEEIELFLKDIADGHYDGKPAMYEDLQTLENPALRAFLKLDPSVRGEIVHKPFSTEANYPLKEWDVITRIGDTPVDDQGMIKLSTNLRVRFQYLVQKIAKGNKVQLTIVRAGKEMKIELLVLNRRPLVLPDLEGAYPSYFIYGPMVFSDATTDFLGAVSHSATQPHATLPYLSALSMIGSPLISRIGDKPAFEGERLVVVSSPFFPHKLTSGYGNPAWQVIKTINGHPIKNLADLVGCVRDLKDDFVTIEFNTRTGGETTVFPRPDMSTASDTILNDNGIRSQGSPDMMKIWNTKS